MGVQNSKQNNPSETGYMSTVDIGNLYSCHQLFPSSDVRVQGDELKDIGRQICDRYGIQRNGDNVSIGHFTKQFPDSYEFIEDFLLK